MTPPIFFIYFLLLLKRPILQKERPLLGKIAKTSVPRRIDRNASHTGICMAVRGRQLKKVSPY